MTRSINVVMLAGRIRSAPLRRQLDLPLPCLPLTRDGTVLDGWLAVIETIGPIESVTVVLNSVEDVEAVRAAHDDAIGRLPFEPIAELAAWRGAGGLLRDVTRHMSTDSIVVAVETSGLPPESLAPLDRVFGGGGAGAVGVCGRDQPAGVYAFTAEAVARIPDVGYYDMKEQFLPALRADDLVVHAVELGPDLVRMRDRRTYLAGVSQALRRGNDTPPQRVSARASVSGSALLDGFCVIEDGSVVEDGAVVQDSVVLSGATIGGGAVVSRSVIGPLAAVAPRSRVVRDVVAGSVVDAPSAATSRPTSRRTT